MRTGSSPLGGWLEASGRAPGLGLPIISINTATYWQALRELRLDDKRTGFGPLFAEF